MINECDFVPDKIETTKEAVSEKQLAEMGIKVEKAPLEPPEKRQKISSPKDSQTTSVKTMKITEQIEPKVFVKQKTDMTPDIEVLEEIPNKKVIKVPPAKTAYNYRCNVCGSKYADQEKMVLHLIADHGITP